MVQAAALRALAGQQVDQVLAEAELHERDRLVHVVERAAEQVDVEALGRGLVAHVEHHVIEAQRLERAAHRLSPTAASVRTPASITAPFSRPERRCRRAKASASRGDRARGRPALWRSASRAACAAGSTTSQA